MTKGRLSEIFYERKKIKVHMKSLSVLNAGCDAGGIQSNDSKIIALAMSANLAAGCITLQLNYPSHW